MLPWFSAVGDLEPFLGFIPSLQFAPGSFAHKPGSVCVCVRPADKHRLFRLLLDLQLDVRLSAHPSHGKPGKPELNQPNAQQQNGAVFGGG